LLYTYITQVVLDMGFYGLAIATNCTRFSTLLLYLMYFRFKMMHHGNERQFFKQIWQPFSKDVFISLGAFA